MYTFIYKIKNMDFNNKERLLLKSLILYYKQGNHLETLLHFLKGKQ